MAGIEDGQFRKILENNVLANHWLIGFVAPQMLERKDGQETRTRCVAAHWWL